MTIAGRDPSCTAQMYPNAPNGQERNNPPPPLPNWPYHPPPSTSQAPSASQAPNGAPPAAYPVCSFDFHGTFSRRTGTNANVKQPPTTLPPLSEHRDMALSYAHHPPLPPSVPTPSAYQYPPPHTMTPYSRPPDSRYAAHPHPYPPQHQPAPRQRTAIACRYCRRRKV